MIRSPIPIALNRRRRLTIAALVLLALGGGLWWSTRPKIDPRLVGTWKLDGSHITFTYLSNGHWTRGDFTTPGALWWYVRDGRLHLYEANRNPVVELWTELKRGYRRSLGKSVYVVPSFAIVDVSGSELVLRDEGGHTLQYRRLK